MRPFSYWGGLFFLAKRLIINVIMKRLNYLLYAAACLMILASLNLLPLKHCLKTASILVYIYAGIWLIRWIYIWIYVRDKKKKRRRR
jgi:prepilin signal peptidase PulO-like enzyme (type II secretory pathway)